MSHRTTIVIAHRLSAEWMEAAAGDLKSWAAGVRHLRCPQHFQTGTPESRSGTGSGPVRVATDAQMAMSATVTRSISSNGAKSSGF